MGARALTLTRMDMDEALVSRQIHLLYQPIFSLNDGSLARVEALVRWDHPRFGTMLPAVFLPAFEAEGRLTALTRRILEKAAAEFASWAFASPSALSINLAPRDCLDTALPDSVKSVLEATHLDPGKLTFECPVKISDASEAAPVLRQLKALGVRLSAEMMGRPEEVGEIFSIAPFDEIKTGGRGLLRAARNNHTASLQGAADLIAFAESKGAIVSAIGAEDEAACLALRTVGFHQVQANVLSPALPIDAITPRVTNAARKVLGLDEGQKAEEAEAEATAESVDEDFKHQRLRAQAEAFKRAAEKKIDSEEEEDILPRPRGARGMQNALAESFGEEQLPFTEAEGADVHEQQEALMQAESKAGLLMRPNLAAASLGYGASPLRRARRSDAEAAAVIVVEPSEDDAKRLSKEPEVAKAITEVLDALPADVAERDITTSADENVVTEDEKADALDAEVAKLPTVDASEAAAIQQNASFTPVNDELLDLAARLRPQTGRKTNFLTRKYKLKVTHFWPKPWKRALMRVLTEREIVSNDQVLDRLGGEGCEKDTVPVMPLRADQVGPLFVARDEGPETADEGPEPLETAKDLGTAEAR
ncbi:hypothetical protein GCM10007148_22160 [Parvularcula lutaonensis]|nr:hypothetical protein GCM10007148_22160 [Parvularcula lutaonensis]